VLSGFVDYPMHQAPVPVSETSSSGINFYDRYFFNGYERDRSSYFSLAMGLYPNRHVADAAFSVIDNDEQISVWGSRDRSWGIRPTGERAPTGAPVPRRSSTGCGHLSTSGSSERGTGILEQLAIGDHPTGLSGIFDPFTQRR
jgi:hypothetical protein